MILWLAYSRLIQAVPKRLSFSGGRIDLDSVQHLPQKPPSLLPRAMSKVLPEEPQPLAEWRGAAPAIVVQASRLRMSSAS